MKNAFQSYMKMNFVRNTLKEVMVKRFIKVKIHSLWLFIL
jgi:hypothetical protein